MAERLCPFSAPLVKQDFGCRYAREIIRRGGAEIACEQAVAHERCIALHSIIRQSSLSAMGHEDDLLTVPHNVLVKIQYGGLLALQALTTTAEQTRIEDIASLVKTTSDTFPDLQNLPFAVINGTIASYKTQRRGKKQV